MEKSENKQNTKKQKIKRILLIQIILVVILIIILNIMPQDIWPRCYIKENLGILCPSCGATRFIISLAKGNILQAFLYHPVFFIGLIYLLCIEIAYILKQYEKENKFTQIFTPKIWHLILGLTILVIFTIVRNLL